VSELDVIHQIARETLTLPIPRADRNSWLWDRTLRILQNIEYICRLPELANQAIGIDRPCLFAAAYFAESGLRHLSEGRKTLGANGAGDAELCEISTQIASEKLAAVTTEARIDKINRIIAESFSRMTGMTEAMILSDARGLEDLGTTGLLGGLHKDFVNGKGISESLESWKRKIEYGYWQVRLAESFRFEAVRRTAEQRFESAEQFMNQLAIENTAGDLKETLVPIPVRN